MFTPRTAWAMARLDLRVQVMQVFSGAEGFKGVLERSGAGHLLHLAACLVDSLGKRDNCNGAENDNGTAPKSLVTAELIQADKATHKQTLCSVDI